MDWNSKFGVGKAMVIAASLILNPDFPLGRIFGLEISWEFDLI